MDASQSRGEFKVPPRTYLLWIAIIGLIPLVVIFRQNAPSDGVVLRQHEFIRMVGNDHIATARINIDSQSPQFHDIRGFHFKVDANGRRVLENGEYVQVPFRARVYLSDATVQQLLNKPGFEAHRPNTLLANIFWSLGPILLVALLIYFVFIRQLARGAFRSRVEPRRASPEFAGIIHIDPQVVQRAPVFVGTDVPLQRLIDALERD